MFIMGNMALLWGGCGIFSNMLILFGFPCPQTHYKGQNMQTQTLKIYLPRSQFLVIMDLANLLNQTCKHLNNAAAFLTLFKKLPMHPLYIDLLFN